MDEDRKTMMDAEQEYPVKQRSADETSDIEEEDEGEETGELDARGVPVWLKYERQPGWHKMWEFMHKLEQPYRVGSKDMTHICLMCMENIAKTGGSWKKALKLVGTTTIGMKHIDRKHPHISQEIELARIEKKAAKAKGSSKRATMLALAATPEVEAPKKKIKMLPKPLWTQSVEIDANLLKTEIQQKIQSGATMTQSTKVQYILLVVIGCLFKHGLISSDARSALKSQAINESDGILLAAVELLLVDWDLDECVDTFLRVSHTILAESESV
ncbi:Aste57867_21592 [Aphanomyces stellatus]|uniref:Aste57867_21592 protein n=1 Tax=Aphanomyces stellatus TaxID=120398 RepID=A0A485LHX9_9STRA|nr:hypothetical protein As57867_021523 [Aphanomyces stellatus]VFT98262.1 Aste57867_21592 [Aphanomyces stellatus]